MTTTNTMGWTANIDAQADEMIALKAILESNSTLTDLTLHVNSTLDAPADANVQLYMAYEAARDAIAAHLASLGSLDVLPAIFTKLVGHDHDTKQAEFDRHEYTCLICLTTHRGRAGIALPRCAHVFCRLCLAPFFTMLIKEGMPMNVQCPHPRCAAVSGPSHLGARDASSADRVTCDLETALARHPITESWLANLIGSDLAAQWRVQFIAKIYAADPTIQWCARPRCTGAARRGDGIYAKMATCMQCQFVFCVFCLRAWHGNASGCESSSAQLVAKAYLDAEKQPKPERDRVHAELAMRYGRAAVMAIVQQHRYENSTKAMLKKLNAQRCPYCRQAVIKAGGCNHMTCATCGGHFCYLCGAGLNHLPNYYVHWKGWGYNLCEGRWEKGRRGDESGDDGV
ncbi:translation termination inhibitor protein itt1 [Allomyces arbusculus]|nr:translation termination inhibitor protein itt1 [Allomyces arbusculus]